MLLPIHADDGAAESMLVVMQYRCRDDLPSLLSHTDNAIGDQVAEL
jgi:hypothetical protein